MSSLVSLRPMKPADRYVIYCWTHVASGRRYVGQSYREERRAAQHMRKGDSLYFRNAVRKYGAEAFVCTVLEVVPMVGSVPTKDEHKIADDAERRWIKQLDCRVPSGFNIAAGGLTGPVHDLTRMRMSAARRARWASLSEDERLKIAQNMSAAKVAMGPERRSEAARKGKENMGAERRRVATCKAIESKGPGRRSEANRKRAETLGSARLSEIASKREQSMGADRRSEAARKRAETMGAERLSAASRKTKATMGPERLSETMRKGKAAMGAERRREAGRKAAATRKLNRLTRDPGKS